MMVRFLSGLACVGLGFLAFSQHAAAFDSCPTAGPAVISIETGPRYSDKQGSIVDEKKERANQEALEPLHQYLEDLVAVAEDYVRTQDAAARDCGLALLRAWAEENSLLGGSYSGHGKATRAWALGTVSLAYIKLGALEQDNEEIDQWLERLADEAMAYEKERQEQFSEYRNIDYWIALSVGATGLAVDRDDYWYFAQEIYEQGLEEIQPDGTLPPELRRGRLALTYHNFAAAPLIAIARLGSLRGEDLFAMEDGSVCRLADLVLKGVKDPQILEQAADAEQKKIGKPYWLPLATGCPDAFQQAGKGTRGTLKMGGDIGTLVKVLDAASADGKTIQ